MVNEFTVVFRNWGEEQHLDSPFATRKEAAREGSLIFTNNRGITAVRVEYDYDIPLIDGLPRKSVNRVSVFCPLPAMTVRRTATVAVEQTPLHW